MFTHLGEPRRCTQVPIFIYFLKFFISRTSIYPGNIVFRYLLSRESYWYSVVPPEYYQERPNICLVGDQLVQINLS